MVPIVIGVSNEKGGSAKTTTAAALVHLFARERERVVGIDLDPQASLTQHLLARVDTGQGMLEMLCGRRPLAQLLVDVPSVRGARIAPSGKLVARAQDEARLMPAGGHLAIRQALRQIDDVDVVVIDTPPTSPHLLNVALAACDFVVSPVLPESACVKGLAMLTHTIDQMQVINPRVQLAGIVPSIVKRRRNETTHVLRWLRQTYGRLVFDAEVRDAAEIPQADRKALAPTAFRPTSNGAQDLIRVFWELRERIAKRAA